MRKPTFSLQSPLSSEIIDVPAPDWLNLYVCGYDIQVQRGQKLAAGAELARHPKPLGGVVHAPMSAVVDKADFAYVTMKASAALDPLPPMDIPEDTDGLREALRTLGVRMDRFMLNREILVINGVNPEPTVSVAEQLMRDAQPTLLRGLEAVRKLIAPQRMVLVTATLDQNLPGCETVRVKPEYPNSLSDLAVLAATGREKPENTIAVSVMKLWFIGRIMETGRPVTDTVFTLAGKNYRAVLGTPLSYILEFAGVPINAGDRLVIGGPMRGYTVYDVDHGLEKGAYAVTVVPKDAFPPMVGDPCINCSECVLHCPARIRPDMIGRYAEYGQFEKTLAYGLASCMECGQCSYWCTARRPLLHYIRFARKELADAANPWPMDGVVH